ncbi:MAG: ISNCY family transposase [Chloroflexota bacterium]
MIMDCYEPVNLFALVPQLGTGFDATLRELDHLLDDDGIVQRIKADLLTAHPLSSRKGRHSTPVEVILRMLLVRRLYHWSYEETEHCVADSLVLRQFCRVYLEAVPDDTTLIRWAHVIGPETLRQLNERVVELARERKVTRGRKLRVDSTVVKTTIHYPTDSGLLVDSVRVISRLLRRAKQGVGADIGLRQEVFRTRNRSVRRLAQQLHRVARRKGVHGRTVLGGVSRRLIGIVGQSRRQAAQVAVALRGRTERRAGRLAEQLEHVLSLVEQVIDQATRRVLQGETVPASEKLVSLFEPQTQIIKRQKPGQPVEFGRKLWLEEVEGGIISGYRVLDQPGQDAPHLPQSLADHQRRFGKPPWLVAGDRGVFSPANERLAEEAGVTHVVIPCAGKASATRKQRERTRWFRQGFRFRAGIEGRISVLGRCFGLDRCPEHGEAGIERHVGWGIVTSNLAKIAETVAQGAATAA